MKRIIGCVAVSIAWAVVIFLATGDLSAQPATPADGSALVRDAVPPASATADEGEALVTGEAARVGVERSRSSEKAPASAAQTTGGTTMKWVIIIGLAVVSALFILAVADIRNI